MSNKNKRVKLKRMSKLIKSFLPIFLLIFYFALISEANAVPSFARQTGMDCAACHTSFPELTPFGREFKLNGYTLGEAKMTPFAIMVQASYNNIAKDHYQNSNGPLGANNDKAMLRQNDITLDQVSLFAAGKVNDHLGAFIQFTQSNANTSAGNDKVEGHSNLDNTDIRLINNYQISGKNLLVGFNLNNNPTVQDVWNSSTAWGFPFQSTGLDTPASFAIPGTIIDGGLAQTSAGLGGYFWYDRHLYGELSFYRPANHAFSLLSAGTAFGDGNKLSGNNNPYWRLAWNEERGPHSFMIGTFGMRADVFPSIADLNTDPNGRATDRYTDTAIDAQYQYISDPSIITLQSSFIHEKQQYGAYTASSTTNSTNTLNSFKAKVSYLYDRKYGATLGYFKTFGSEDSNLYPYAGDLVGGSNTNSGFIASNKPSYEWYVAEVDYNPRTNVRLSMQYTGYLKWAGFTSNYDGYGRNPSDNNLLSLNLWFAY